VALVPVPPTVTESIAPQGEERNRRRYSILVSQDVRDVGDAVENSRTRLGAGGNLPQNGVIVGVEPPFSRATY